MDDFLNKAKLNNKILPVILSGGTGTRLWPLSRSSLPKQYLNLDKESNNSLLQDTFLRLKGIKNLSNPLVICNEHQRFIVAEQFRSILEKPWSILLEPFGKNTAPAIALASLICLENEIDPFLLILSSDHKIKNKNNFQESINEGLKFAREGKIVTFGIRPTEPNSGYGYIESEEKITSLKKASNIRRFIEKPSKEKAEEFLKDGHYTWNSGIFLFKSEAIIREFKRHHPNLLDICKNSLKQNSQDFDFRRINERFFKECPDISIDKAVMEKTNNGKVIFLDAGWNDLGSWRSVWEDSDKDSNRNTLIGKTIIKNVSNSYIRSESKLVVGMGLQDILLIDTDDALLVAEKKSINFLKDLVKELDEKNFEEVKINSKVHRPWGNFISLTRGKTWQVKMLEINPNSSLSLQKHYHRSEHWVVVRNTAKVEIEGKISFLKENESIYVPKGDKHRLSNPNDAPLILIEVQCGNYLGEDDIVRFKDKYNRT